MLVWASPLDPRLHTERCTVRSGSLAVWCRRHSLVSEVYASEEVQGRGAFYQSLPLEGVQTRPAWLTIQLTFFSFPV